MPHRLFPSASALMLTATLGLTAGSAKASVPAPLQTVPQPGLVGEARLKVMLWNVFDARLYAPGGAFDASRPFALSLSYLRALEGRKIVESTMEEIRAQGFDDAGALARWRSALETMIPDVDKGDTITGVRDADGHTLLFLDDTLLGRIAEPTFTALFFDIWLGESTSKPELRRQLIAGTAS